MAGSWGCPHELNGVCQKVNRTAPRPGSFNRLVLYGRYAFATPKTSACAKTGRDNQKLDGAWIMDEDPRQFSPLAELIPNRRLTRSFIPIARASSSVGTRQQRCCLLRNGWRAKWREP